MVYRLTIEAICTKENVMIDTFVANAAVHAAIHTIHLFGSSSLRNHRDSHAITKIAPSTHYTKLR